MKKTLTTLALALSAMVGTTFAQQDPQYTQFMHCKIAYNPAFAGTNGGYCFNALYRQQWVNFPGAPKTGLFAFDGKFNTFGIGLLVINDQLGFDKTTMGRLSFAFHRQLGPGLFSVGIDAGIMQKRINGNFVAPQTLDDPSIPSNPNGTGAPPLDKAVPDFGAGLYYTIPNKMYVGISTSHIAAQDIKSAQVTENSGANPPVDGVSLNFRMARHYYIMGGYTFMINPDHSITPNVKIKSDAASTIFDINLTYMMKNMIWLGVTYRNQDAVAPMLGYMAPFGLKIGYSYDVTLSKIKGYSAGTHEIMLGYCFIPKPKDKRQSHGTSRFLE